MGKLFLLSLILLCYAYQVQAKNYQIEMIIFSHFTFQNKAEEQWPNLDPNNFNFKYATTTATLLHPAQFILKNEQNQLNQKPTYQILLHIAWRQSVVDARHAQTMHIQGKNVDGTICVSIRRYLNVTLNLLFKNNLDYFYLSENRRMRSNELNYIDFPVYGVLIKIVPNN